MLDTHDGIGIIDVVPDPADRSSPDCSARASGRFTGAGNNGPLSTAMASSFPTAAGMIGGDDQ